MSANNSHKKPEIVEVSGLSKNYGDIKAVDSFSFSVKKGEILALVGPDGAGKTSIFRSLCNLIDFDSGEITIGGFNLLNEFEKIKPLLGYMPQTFSLYQDLSVEENLNFYAGLFGMDKELLPHKIEKLYKFSGLGSFAKRRASALSGGMRQKLALSCNLIHDPEILFLDEPTTGVDPLSRRQFWDILKSLRDSGSTIIVSTPYMDEVALADYAIFIYQGSKLAEGIPDKLSEKFEGTVYHVDIFPDATTMSHLNQLEGLSSRRFGSSLHIYIESAYALDSFYDRFENFGIKPDMLVQIKPDIEDIFMQLMSK
jgi:ABC-2 type transport system ATP-binding protein